MMREGRITDAVSVTGLDALEDTEAGRPLRRRVYASSTTETGKVDGGLPGL